MLLPDDAALAGRDPALPGLATLLDSQALLACMAGQPGLHAETVEVLALRYRPGHSAVASLRLGGAGEQRLASAHVWASQAPKPNPGGAESLVLPDLRLAISPLGDDPRLPNLAAALDPAARETLCASLGVPAPPPAADLEVLSYRPQRRLTVRCGPAEQEALVLKLYRGGGFRRAVLRQHWRRRETDLAAQSFLADSQPRRCIALAWHPGRPLATRLRAGEGAAALQAVAEDCAERLADLHRRAAPSLPMLEDADLETHLETQLGALAVVDPALLPEARAVLAAPLPSAATPAVTLHGDFHAKQILTSDQGVLLLDLDGACRGEPERDLACFSAHLRRDAAMRRVSAGVADAIDARFQAAYAETSPGVSAARVRALTRRLLLGMASYPFRVRHPEWRSQAAAIVAAARSLGDG